MKIKSKKGFAAKWAVLIGLTIAIVAAIIIAVVVAKNNNGNEVVDTSSTTTTTATAADTTVKETETTVTTTVTQAAETTKENITVTSTKAADVKTTVKPTAATKVSVKFTDVNKTYYALSNGTVRYEPYDDAGSECRMTRGEEVFVIAKGDNGWWKVKYNGNVRYVWYQNLTENKPTTAAPTKKQSSGNSGNSGSPKPGDRKVVNGQAYVYDDLWGWIRDTGSGLCDDGIDDSKEVFPDQPGYAH